MNLLVVSAGKYGTTKAAAQKVAQHLKRAGHTVQYLGLPCGQPQDRPAQAERISKIESMIIGTPLYYGKCPDEVIEFIRTYTDALKQTRVLVFFTCLRLTRDTAPLVFGNVYVDPQLTEPPKAYARMGLMEKSHSIGQYLSPVTDLFNQAGITELAFFKGNLNFKQLNFKSRMVMLLMTRLMSRVCQGNFLDTDAVCQWAQERISPKALRENNG